MMIKLSKEEMLREWKRRKGMLPVSTSTMVVEMLNSQSVDEMLMAEIDDWYSHLLATEHQMLLPQRDLKEEAKVTDNGDGSVEVELPAACVRPISVRLSGWKRAARIVEDSEGALARMQTSRYVRGGSSDPIAVVRGRRLTLYSKVDDGGLQELTCIAAPADGSYEMERGLLFSIY